MNIETREVLAAVYRNPHGRMLSHAAEIGEDGEPVKALCGKVRSFHLADRHASDPTATPTCSVCRGRLKRLAAEGPRVPGKAER